MQLDFRRLFDSEDMHDVVLNLEGADGETGVLPAHRVVLVSSSTYFSSMFSSAWDPQSSSPEMVAPSPTATTGASSMMATSSMRRVRIVSDEQLAHVRLFFAFLYGVELELDLSLAHPLLRLADFYGVDALMTQCLRFLERVLHPQPTRCFPLFDASTSSTSSAPQPPPQERLIQLCTEVLARSFSLLNRLQCRAVQCRPMQCRAVQGSAMKNYLL